MYNLATNAHKSHYISELAHMFLCSYDEHIDTGEFMTRLTEILSSKENQGKSPQFDIFLCSKDKKNGKYNLNKYISQDEKSILECVFDLCGCKGYDVWRLREGHHRGGFLFWEIWVYRDVQ